MRSLTGVWIEMQMQPFYLPNDDYFASNLLSLSSRPMRQEAKSKGGRTVTRPESSRKSTAAEPAQTRRDIFSSALS